MDGIDAGIHDKVKQYVFENFLFGGKSRNIDSMTSFLESGIIDSTGILEIVHYLEEEFAIKVEDEEIVPENLDSLRNIAAYVQRKKLP
jgi:acyl carrier protein